MAVTNYKAKDSWKKEILLKNIESISWKERGGLIMVNQMLSNEWNECCWRFVWFR